MIGRKIGHYEVTELLGVGGMGEVYRAKDTKLERDVALKVLPEEMAADPDRLERFRTEARAVAALNHPEIVTIHSVEEVEGIHFLTMELVDGHSVDQLTPESGLPLDQFLKIATVLADALAAAHDQGIVHRDIKPANVMVATNGRVKVLDFGLAKLAAAEAGVDEETQLQALTQQGMVLGTVPYMAPEQLQGKAADYRTDIFSLGVTLYEMATGKRPHCGESSAELISAILRDKPQSVTSMRSGIPPDLARLIDRCLEKDPDRRYQTVHEISNELSTLEKRRDQKLEPDKLDAGRRLSRQTSRWLLSGFGLVAVVAVVLALVIVFSGDESSRISTTQSVAVLPFVDMSPEQRNAYLGEGIAEALINALANVPDLGVAARTSAFSFRDKNIDAREIGRQLSVNAVLEGSVQKIGDRLRVTAQLISTSDGLDLWSQRFDRDAADIFTVQDEVAIAVVQALQARLLNQDSPADSGTQDPEAYDAYLQGRFLWNQRSIPDQNRAITYFELAIEKDPDFAEAWVGLANVYVTLPFYSSIPTGDAIPKARKAVERALAIDEGLTDAHATLAFINALFDWDWESSDLGFRRALELNPDNTIALKWYSDVLSMVGRDEEALKAVERAAQLEPLSSNIRTILAKWYWIGGKSDEAMTEFNRALELDPTLPLALMHKSWLCWSLGDMEEFFKTREQLERVSSRSEVSASELRLAYERGGPEAVLRLQLLAPEAERFPVDRARWHTLLGEFDEAFRDLDQALDERTVWLPFTVNFPELEPLRGDPRYQKILETLGLNEVRGR